MELNRVVITGMGCLTPLGKDVPSFFDALKRGVSGAGPITRFDASQSLISQANCVLNLDASKRVMGPAPLTPRFNASK